MSAGQIDIAIQNQSGSLGSNADVTANISGGLTTTTSSAIFAIDNFDAGFIGGGRRG